MRSNFLKVIFFFLFFPSLSFCQNWPPYSDSVYTLIKKNDWKSAYQLTHKVDSLLSVEGYSNDTIYADYLYRRGILKNAIQEYDWDVDFNQGADASEYFLKQVSSPRVLHIATHGYFHDSKNDSERDNLNFLSNNLTNFDNPLLRSGVLLSGSENTIRGEVFSQENGILNALEAKNLDLVNTELVVLSACETGLGEYVSGEGVYGLQRSILEAGSDNVIMSLWKVDDQATQLLINTFYSNWLEQGMSKREALRQAQLYMLNTDKYKSPFYWGAFVLIEK